MPSTRDILPVSISQTDPSDTLRSKSFPQRVDAGSGVRCLYTKLNFGAPVKPLRPAQ
jgi:hypothetical protein